MALTKTKKIGIGTGIVTLVALMSWFALSPDFTNQFSGDQFCQFNLIDKCIISWNTTFTPVNPLYKTFYLKNPSGIKLNFTPQVDKYETCVPDGRCKHCGICPEGFRNITLMNWTFKKGIKTQFLFIILKDKPEKVKWSISALGDTKDPVFYPTLSAVNECRNETYTESKPIMGKCNYTYETSNCTKDFTTYPNGTKSCNATYTYDCQTGTSTKTLTKQICDRAKYAYKDKFIINEWNCNMETMICDSCKDGNCDGIVQSGESYLDLDNEKYRLDTTLKVFE